MTLREIYSYKDFPSSLIIQKGEIFNISNIHISTSSSIMLITKKIQRLHDLIGLQYELIERICLGDKQ